LDTLFFFYFYVFNTNHEPTEKLIWGSPILGIITLAWILKNTINLYYTRRITNHELELAELKAKQKSKLEEYARQTDFYKTREILNRYSKTLQPPESPQPSKNPKQVIKTPSDSTGLRHRPTTPVPQQQQVPPSPTIASFQQQQQQQQQVPPSPTIASFQQQQQQQQQVPPPQQIPQPAPSQPVYMAVPVDHVQMRSHPNIRQAVSVDPNRPWYDKLVDFLVGDSPDQSVALICVKCKQHNGLVPPDEIETIQFKCRYCNHFNEKSEEKKTISC